MTVFGFLKAMSVTLPLWKLFAGFAATCAVCLFVGMMLGVILMCLLASAGRGIYEEEHV